MKTVNGFIKAIAMYFFIIKFEKIFNKTQLILCVLEKHKMNNLNSTIVNY